MEVFLGREGALNPPGGDRMQLKLQWSTDRQTDMVDK